MKQLMPTKHEELIKHLSKEVEMHGSHLMIFRSRVVFAVLAAPFIFMSPFLIAPMGTFTTEAIFSRGPIVASCVAAAFLYMCFGVICFKCDRGMGEQCNKWRSLIIDLSQEKDITTLDEKHFLHEPRSSIVYTTGFLVIVLMFVCIMLIMYFLTQTPPPCSDLSV